MIGNHILKLKDWSLADLGYELPLDDYCLNLIFNDKIISAIKLYRCHTDAGLKEAKDHIDGLINMINSLSLLEAHEISERVAGLQIDEDYNLIP